MPPTTIAQSRLKLGGWAVLFLAGGLTFTAGTVLSHNLFLVLLFAIFALTSLIGAGGWGLRFVFPHRLFLDAEGFELRMGLSGVSKRAGWREVGGFSVGGNAIEMTPNPDFAPAALAAFAPRFELPIEWPMSRKSMVERLNTYREAASG